MPAENVITLGQRKPHTNPRQDFAAESLKAEYHLAYVKPGHSASFASQTWESQLGTSDSVRYRAGY
jgi:hypothetical protein